MNRIPFPFWMVPALVWGCNEYELKGQTDPERPGEDTAVWEPEENPAVPVAISEQGSAVKRYESITIDGSQSYDPDDDDADLVYAWSLDSSPEGATATFTDTETAQPALSGDTLGLYVVSLVVTDEEELISENLAGATVEVIPYESLRVDLSWDTSDLDLDLHLVSPEGIYYEDTDCYFGNPDPDWGAVGVDSDNPSLDGDQEGAGEPESIRLWYPEEGTYTIFVHYFNDRDAIQTYTTPTVTIYAEGEVLGLVAGPLLDDENDVWEVGTLDWTSLNYTESSNVTTHTALGGPTTNEKSE